MKGDVPLSWIVSVSRSESPSGFATIPSFQYSILLSIIASLLYYLLSVILSPLSIIPNINIELWTYFIEPSVIMNHLNSYNEYLSEFRTPF